MAERRWRIGPAMGLVRGVAHLAFTQDDTTQWVIQGMASDATKLLADACERQWYADHSDMILRHGVLGYESLVYQFGLIGETKEMSAARQEKAKLAGLAPDQLLLHAFLTDCYALLSLGEPGNRTLFYDCLQSCPVVHPIVEKLLDLLDLVHEGAKDWHWYHPQAMLLLTELKMDVTPVALHG